MQAATAINMLTASARVLCQTWLGGSSVTGRKAHGKTTGDSALASGMPNIFISYRRDDSSFAAELINTKLREHFGRECVFIDVDNLPLGQDFRHKLHEAVGKCDVLLALIGKGWLNAEFQGHRRLENPDDFVRIEISFALSREIPVIPVLLDAPMPSEAELPEPLQPLSYRNATEVRSGRDTKYHLERLVQDIETLFDHAGEIDIEDENPYAGLLQQARDFFGRQQYAQALETLKRIPDSESSREVKDLRRQVENALEAANEQMLARAELDRARPEIEAAEAQRLYQQAIDRSLELKTALDQYTPQASILARSWVHEKLTQLSSALSEQREYESQLFGQAQQQFDELRYDIVVEILENAAQPLLLDDARELLHAARERLVGIATAEKEIETRLARHDYEGLIDRVYWLRDNASIDDDLKARCDWLEQWETLDNELRRRVMSCHGEPFLRLRSGDERQNALQFRLERALEAARLWEHRSEALDEPALLQQIKEILRLDPEHREANRQCKPLYRGRGWMAHVFRGHQAPIVSVAFSANSRQVISRDASGACKTWCLESDAEIIPRKRDAFHDRQMYVSPLGDYALSGFGSREITLWDAKSGEQLGLLEGHAAPVTCICFAPNGTLALSVSDDGTIRVWDLEFAQQTHCLSEAGFFPLQASFSSEGSRVLANGRGTLRIWNLSTGKIDFRLQLSPELICLPYFSPDMRYVAWIEATGGVELFDTNENRQVGSFGKRENCFCFSPDGHQLATGNTKSWVRIWETNTGTLAGDLKEHRLSVNCVAFSPDGTRLASASDDETIRLWDWKSDPEKAVRLFAGHRTTLWKKMSAKYGNVKVIAFSPDGRFVTSGSDDTTVRVWYAAL